VAPAVASAIWKNVARKMMKIAGGSPMPNQMIANGIHAIGDSVRKKFTHGRSAARASAKRPSTRPERAAAISRRRRSRSRRGRATRRCRRPSGRSTARRRTPRDTASGGGTVPRGNCPVAEAIHHAASKSAPTARGKTQRSTGGTGRADIGRIVPRAWYGTVAHGPLRDR
jgi:hypothetical protein